jgi:hypothetical protein
MRNLLLTTAATAALLSGLVAAGAQQDPPRRDQPSAEQSQPMPRARDQIRERGSRAQDEIQRNPQVERSTTGQSSERSADEPQRSQTQRNMREQEPRRGRTTEDRNRSRERSTTGQSQQQRSTDRPDARSSDQAGEQRGVTRHRSTTGQSQERATQDRATRDRSTQERTTQDRATRSQTRQRGSLQMSEEQRTRVTTRFSESIDRMNVRPLSRTNISVSIGAPLPRSVHFHPVPRDIIAIYPQFRGHSFVVVEDEIVIVEPRTRRVVTVLPRDGSHRVGRAAARETTGSAAAGSRLRIEPRVRDEIRTVVMQQPSCRLEQRVDFFLFVPLPRTVEVCELPPQIVSDAPELRQYRYVVRGDEIALVDPDDHRIVEVIR